MANRALPMIGKAPTAFVRSVRTRSVVDEVLAEIRRSIVFGALAPGQEFSLRETATQLGVSTAPVRAALQVLQSEGLIVARRARSAVVAPIDMDDLRSIYSLRRRIEPALAAEACTQLSDAQLAKLDRMVSEVISGAKHSIDDIYETHRQFHLGLLRPAATAWDLRVLETLWQAAERYVRIGFGRLDPLPEEHKRRETAHNHLLDAFRKRDPEVARVALLGHLEKNEILATRALGWTP